MTQLGEAVFSVPPEPEETDEEIEDVKIRFSVFFDGTLNNRTNIEQRLVSAKEADLTEEERKTATDLKQEMTIEQLKEAKGIYKKFSGVGSYENGYTNVVKLERYIDTEIPSESDYQYLLKSYIEGPGTRDKKSDKTLGYAIGVGVSGVKKKVKQGVQDVVKKVSGNHFDKKAKIAKLTLDAFGFSRGAAAARNFIHEALLGAKSVKQQLQDKGYQVGEVELCFAGLYDTVSSHGLVFSNDTDTLKLDAVAHAKEVVHLAAADEHRENFSLTTVESAANGIQIFLPGVHSDVGGSYREGASENHDVYWTMGKQGEKKVQKQKEELVAAGWYKADELTIQQSSHMHGGRHNVKEVNLHAERSNISNQYSRIPLHIMVKFTRKNKIIIKSKLERVENIPAELSTAQKEILDYVGKHEAKGGFSSKSTDWHDNKRSWLRDLRHSNFHFSARLEIGNGPRYINGKRERMYYDG